MRNRAAITAIVFLVCFCYAAGCIATFIYGVNLETVDPEVELFVYGYMFGGPFLIFILYFVLWIVFGRERGDTDFDLQRIVRSVSTWLYLVGFAICGALSARIWVSTNMLMVVAIPALGTLIAALGLLMNLISRRAREQADAIVIGVIAIVASALFSGRGTQGDEFPYGMAEPTPPDSGAEPWSPAGGGDGITPPGSSTT